MAKIVIIAPAEADDDVKDAVKLLKAAGHDVDTEEPTPKSLLHIVLGLMGPNGYGFGPGYAYLPGGGSNTPPPKDEPAPEEDPAEEPAPEEDPAAGGGDDDFNFESLGTVTVDGELIEAVTFDSETSVLCVESLEAGAKTTYSLNESVFSFFPADATKPTLRVEVLVDKHRTSIELAIKESTKAVLLVGKDLREMFGPMGGDQRNHRGSQPEKKVKQKPEFDGYLDVEFVKAIDDKVKDRATKYGVKLKATGNQLRVTGDKKGIIDFLAASGWDRSDLEKWYPQLSA